MVANDRESVHMGKCGVIARGKTSLVFSRALKAAKTQALSHLPTTAWPWILQEMGVDFKLGVAIAQQMPTPSLAALQHNRHDTVRDCEASCRSMNWIF